MHRIQHRLLHISDSEGDEQRPPPPPPPRAATKPRPAATTAPSLIVPANAPPAVLAAALTKLLPPLSGAPLRASLTKSVPPKGDFAGHCLFASLLRSAGDALPPREELAAVMRMRALCVLTTVCRVAVSPGDPVLLDAACAAAVAAEVEERGSAPSDTLAVLAGYLAASLSPKPTSESQHAGPFELAALSTALGRTVVVLVEAGSKDSGAMFAGAPGVAPLVAVNSRRRHTIGVVVQGGGLKLVSASAAVDAAISAARAKLAGGKKLGAVWAALGPVVAGL